MKNFYKKGRGLPNLILASTKKSFLINKINHSEITQLDEEIFFNAQKEKHETYLASLVYEYKLSLKYILSNQGIIENIKTSQEIVMKSLNIIQLLIMKPFTNRYMFSVLIIYLLICNVAVNFASGQEKISGHKSEKYYPSEKEINYIKSMSDENLLSLYPLFNYWVDSSLVTPIIIGDSIPDELLHLPLWVVGKNTTSDTIRLVDFPKDKLLIIDFWASWCSPCVASMEKWESFVDSLGGQIELLGVNIDYSYKAYPFIKKRGWKSLSVIGLNGFVLNRYFFDRPVISRMAWIKGGKLIAITGTKGLNLEMVKKVASGDGIDIPNNYQWTYKTQTN